jgi:hypothetical protein
MQLVAIPGNFADFASRGTEKAIQLGYCRMFPLVSADGLRQIFADHLVYRSVAIEGNPACRPQQILVDRESQVPVHGLSVAHKLCLTPDARAGLAYSSRHEQSKS